MIYWEEGKELANKTQSLEEPLPSGVMSWFWNNGAYTALGKRTLNSSVNVGDLPLDTPHSPYLLMDAMDSEALPGSDVYVLWYWRSSTPPGTYTRYPSALLIVYSSSFLSQHKCQYRTVINNTHFEILALWRPRNVIFGVT